VASGEAATRKDRNAGEEASPNVGTSMGDADSIHQRLYRDRPDHLGCEAGLG
jgi:hypothetical protein